MESIYNGCWTDAVGRHHMTACDLLPSSLVYCLIVVCNLLLSIVVACMWWQTSGEGMCADSAWCWQLVAFCPTRWSLCEVIDVWTPSPWSYFSAMQVPRDSEIGKSPVLWLHCVVSYAHFVTLHKIANLWVQTCFHLTLILQQDCFSALSLLTRH